MSSSMVVTAPPSPWSRSWWERAAGRAESRQGGSPREPRGPGRVIDDRDCRAHRAGDDVVHRADTQGRGDGGERRGYEEGST